jgi:hypothetical protein
MDSSKVITLAASVTCARCQHSERVKPINADGICLSLYCLSKQAYVHCETSCEKWEAKA